MAETFRLPPSEKKLIVWHLVIGVVAISIGGSLGLFQILNHGGIDWYGWLSKIGIKNYYQGLTLHGVLNAIVWTTYFIMAFLTFNVVYGLKQPLKSAKVNWLGFWVMTLGVVLAAIPIWLNQATVLYTFYPPMLAPWFFYLGLALLVVGSWIEGWGLAWTYFAWRKANPGQRSPFIAFASVLTFLLWQLATIGVAAEVLILLLPWSLGLTPGLDVELARTLFWWFGHPLVYFWLLPAYISWYGYLPRQAGGKLFSDTLARLAFWLFLLLSVPVGFHHQYLDPGVPPTWRYIHALLTLSVVVPSMMTLFTVVASLEYAGRKRGGKGLLGWIRALPWGDPSVAAQLLAGLIFVFGGIGGVINASYNVNMILHNTTWVSGHFHLTVGTAVTLTFIGIFYWWAPYLTGKPLPVKLARVQVWLYAIGMAIFSQAMHALGLLGAPRRTPLGNAPYIPPEWQGLLLRELIGGILLVTGGTLFIVIAAYFAFAKPKERVTVEPPVAEALQDPQLTPAWLDTWRPWVVGAVFLVLLAYTPVLLDLVQNMVLVTAPRIPLW